MKIYLGILGDPAKFKLYAERFYSLLDLDELNSLFYLIGASETDVTSRDYKKMYNNIIQNIQDDKILSLFSNTAGRNSKIGLFPSSPKHLITGPGFIFAPYPINSRSIYLKIKSRFISKILSPFVKSNIIPIAYFPHGGKAGVRTKANTEIDLTSMSTLIKKAVNDNWIKYLYIEAGSGSKVLESKKIQSYFNIIAKEIDTISINSTTEILPNVIYGGGINSVDILSNLLYSDNIPHYLPQIFIIGNVSENDINITVELIRELNTFNKSITSKEVSL